MLQTLYKQGLLPRRAWWMKKKKCEKDIDVARFEHLEQRARRKDRKWIDVTRDLLVVDRRNKPRLLVLTEVMRDK